MTREEAIHILYGVRANYLNHDDWQIRDRYKSLCMAINALEQEPCEDAISREKAINLLNKYFTRLYYDHAECLIEEFEALSSVQPKYNANEWCKDCKEYDHDKHCCPRFNKVVRKTIEEIKQPKTGHWISVSERLPEKNVEVLATTEWGAVTIAEMYSANDWFIHEGTTNAETDEIVAWMPLPEPYKMESEG